MTSDLSVDAVVDTARAVRERTPLVQCITNYVSMDVAANLLNAAHASPAMVHDVNEAADMAALASAVTVNIGTLSPPWVEGMHAAAGTAHDRGIPWVLDPVAVGATRYRRETVTALLAHRPTVLRANASEILAIATARGAGRGVDSTDDSIAIRHEAERLAGSLGTVVVVSGATDVVTDGGRTVLVEGGDPRMPLISALGCAASALVAATCACAADPWVGAASAMTILAAAGRVAGESAAGPGTLRPALLDALYLQQPDDLRNVVWR
ncbi:hydroxyethylthiazole kinase [Aeromicrobium sp. PE09-221]|uniref:hydroxyethylthiazole kinase n=1 Tax=Aeromicrobium sp. PE09-221 TaxID=1898043 RepID=UPI000B3E9831|nr:hydroxyethylthiazole kinase [Aeromicrobium sp. PE09-221]OUZ11349.1 hydroxyethylthiazole kinase [Aeromicrobium sp. PE09-221]